MLLNQIIATQHAQYADIQLQIEALQEQQRQIQAYLQKLGGVESRMESAAQLLQQAIADIREVCPDELPAYQELVNGLFGSQPVAELVASVDDIPPEEIETISDDSLVITNLVTELGEVESERMSPDKSDDQPTNTVIDVTATSVDETASKYEEVADKPALSYSAIDTLKKSELTDWCSHYGLSTDGVVKDLRSRLKVHVLSLKNGRVTTA